MIDRETEMALIVRHQAGDRTATEELAQSFRPAVLCIAKRIYRSLAKCRLSIADMTQEGMICLVDAMDRFDTSRGLRLSTFAVRRINGGIYDAIRNYDLASRVGRAKGDTTEYVYIDWNNRDSAPIVPRNEAGGSDGIDIEEFWRQAAKGLSKQQRILLLCYFRDGRTMKDVGEDLGLSESRCSQMLKQIKQIIRSRETEETLYV